MSVALPKPGLEGLLDNLRQMGYQTIGPRLQDRAITYGPIDKLADLPRGTQSEQDSAHYHLSQTGSDRYFDFVHGPHTWKQFLFPPSASIIGFQRAGDGQWQIETATRENPSYAFFGVRPCELAAIQVQDRVFLREEWKDPLYRARRQNAFIVAVNCMRPDGTCFCASMGTGPKATSGYDICLTELEDVFLVEIGSEAGRMAMANLPMQPASAFRLSAAQQGLEAARHKMGRTLPEPEKLPEVLLNNLEAEHWDKVAHRCMSCGNCTQVCPTCFCWDARDMTDLTMQKATRERVWDSCFNPDYSYVAGGGNTRPTTHARYRQWLTHKFASWYEQFDVSGCVGCGRCITWCPAKIDHVAEIAAIREEVQA
jgi:ferredoxin